jgi:predicted Zn-dependent protease
VSAPRDADPTRVAIDAMNAAKEVAPNADIGVSLTRERSANTRFARNEVTSCGDYVETVVRVSIALGRKHAEASTNQIDAHSLRTLAERALAMARVAPEDREHMPLVGKQTFAQVDAAYDAPTAAARAEERASAIAAAVAEAERAGVTAAGFYHSSAIESRVVNTAGSFGAHRETNASLTMTARTADATGSGWAGADSQRASELDAAALARVACEKATRSAKPRALDPGRYTVILEPAAVAELLAFFVQALDARRADEGRSFFAKKGGGTKLGEKIFPETISLASDPTSADTPGAPFDDEGLALEPVTWIDRGVVSALRYSRFWAAKQQKKATGAHATMLLRGGTVERAEDLLVGVKRGLLVTRFWYTRWLDPKSITITGLTRDGVFLIEDGRITAPARNFRFNESPVTMLANCDAMTKRTVRAVRGGAWRVPALRTNGFNMASVSEAV